MLGLREVVEGPIYRWAKKGRKIWNGFLWINIKKKIRGSKVSGDPFVGSRN